MRIIWIQDKPLLLRLTSEPVPEGLGAGALPLPEFHGVPADIRLVIRNLESNLWGGCLVVTDHIQESFDRIFAGYRVWEAAGGLITDPEKKVLLLFRRGKWDLPKGKLDEGETLEDCALREVREETGLYTLGIKNLIGETYHAYTLSESRDRILKHTHWYRMEFSGRELTIPQIEEDIRDIQWIAPSNLDKYLRHSYANIRHLFTLAGYGPGAG